MSWELREEARRREEERNRIEAREEEFARDVREIASRPEGKRFLRRLMEGGDIFNPAYVSGVSGAYMAGKKAQALMLWQHLRQHLPRQDCLDLLVPDTSPETGTLPGEAGPSGRGEPDGSLV